METINQSSAEAALYIINLRPIDDDVEHTIAHTYPEQYLLGLQSGSFIRQRADLAFDAPDLTPYLYQRGIKLNESRSLVDQSAIDAFMLGRAAGIELPLDNVLMQGDNS